jgi:hypothetical protein
VDTPSRPYRAAEPAENRDTFIGTFRLENSPRGRLDLREARFMPAVLDQEWEARAAEGARVRGIADRLQRFCAERATPTAFEEGALVWTPNR